MASTRYRTGHSTPLRLRITDENRKVFGAEALIEENADNMAAYSYHQEILIRWDRSRIPSPDRLAEIRSNWKALAVKHPDLGELKLDTDTYALFNRRFQG